MSGRQRASFARSVDGASKGGVVGGTMRPSKATAGPFGAEMGILPPSMTLPPGRPAGSGMARSFHRQPSDEVALHAARTAGLGLRHSVRSIHQDVVLRRSVHATGREHAARDRIGGAHRKRRDARDDRVLRARDEHNGHSGAFGKSQSVDTRLSTRQRLSWRQRRAAPGTFCHQSRKETASCRHDQLPSPHR
jgi:hypothetical protein